MSRTTKSGVLRAEMELAAAPIPVPAKRREREAATASRAGWRAPNISAERTVVAVMAVTLVPVFLHALPAAMAATSRAALLAVAARALAQCGLAMLVWHAALGSRLLARALTPDLGAVDRVRKPIAAFALFLLVAHGALLWTLPASQAVAPYPAVFDGPLFAGYAAMAILMSVWMASRFLRNQLNSRARRVAEAMADVGMLLALLHGVAMSGRTAADMSIFWGCLGTAALAVASARVALAAGLAQSEYVVTRVLDIRPGVRTLVLEPLTERLEPEAGQFLYVRLRRFGEARPLSVAHRSTVTSAVSVTIKAADPFSRALHDMTPGKWVWADGPYLTCGETLPARRLKAV